MPCPWQVHYVLYCRCRVLHTGAISVQNPNILCKLGGICFCQVSNLFFRNISGDLILTYSKMRWTCIKFVVHWRLQSLLFIAKSAATVEKLVICRRDRFPNPTRYWYISFRPKVCYWRILSTCLPLHTLKDALKNVLLSLLWLVRRDFVPCDWSTRGTLRPY